MLEIAIRWSGVPLTAGAALLGVAIIMVSLNPVIGQALSPRLGLLLFLSSILLLLSLPGMYARQAAAAGALGLWGYALLQVGVILLLLVGSTPLLYPTLGQPMGESVPVFLLGIALTVGLLLTGIATIRAGVFPRWAGFLLFGATVGFFFSFFIAELLPPIAGQVGSAFFGIVLSLALMWIGLALLTG